MALEIGRQCGAGKRAPMEIGGVPPRNWRHAEKLFD